MNYDLILFDADNTLFDFDAAEAAAFRAAFADFGIPFEEHYRGRYQVINEGLWRQHERGEVELAELVNLRFRRLFQELGIAQSAEPFNTCYLDELANNAHLIPGALESCKALSPAYKLVIVTNGVARTQHKRIEASPLRPYIWDVFISQELGCKKPEPAFFDAVFAALGQPDRSRALLVGDSLSSDIQGGNNAGIATCWFNPHQKPKDRPVVVDYEIQALEELVEMLCPTANFLPTQRD